jgi:siroheme synthase (precorrin-2 oxidase/ferrochelatase)
MRRKPPSTIRYDPEQKEVLDLISRFTRGTPAVAKLVREAIKLYIDTTLGNDAELRAKVMSEIEQRRQTVVNIRLIGEKNRTSAH